MKGALHAKESPVRQTPQPIPNEANVGFCFGPKRGFLFTINHGEQENPKRRCRILGPADQINKSPGSELISLVEIFKTDFLKQSWKFPSEFGSN